jgi:hypothetical protein
MQCTVLRGAEDLALLEAALISVPAGKKITLHYITLHYITLHYITLHYITLHYITLHYITCCNTSPCCKPEGPLMRRQSAAQMLKWGQDKPCHPSSPIEQEHLAAVAPVDLDAVVVLGVVGGCDHDACCTPLHAEQRVGLTPGRGAQTRIQLLGFSPER